LHPELLGDVADELATTPEALDRWVRDLGRRTAHLGQLTWHRLDQVLGRRASSRPRRRRPVLVRLDDGVASAGGEVVLDRDARPGTDPWLVLRVAVASATAGLVLAPTTVGRLAGTTAPLGERWPEHARRLLVRLLASGPGLVPVWEELDQSGLVDALLPEWQQIRLRTSGSAVHRFTVDRHLVETCVGASRLLADVARPDLLVVAALLHDIGKGDPDGRDHSEVGAQLAAAVAWRWGFCAVDCETIADLVRHHLLLPRTAVRRDIDDPATLAGVATLVGDGDRLDLLVALAEADARAAAPAAWTTWRAGLVQRLAVRLRGRFAAELGQDRPDSVRGLEPVCDLAAWAADLASGELRVVVEPQTDGTRVLVAAAERSGLLADIAAALATATLPVRAARAAVHAGTAVSSWDVAEPAVDVAALRLRLDRVLTGRADHLAARFGRDLAPTDARVRLLPGVSASATVLEVRAGDREGLVWRLFRALADADVDVRSAHLETLGPQAEDVVYVTDRSGRPLSAERAEQVRRAVGAAMGAPLPAEVVDAAG